MYELPQAKLLEQRMGFGHYFQRTFFHLSCFTIHIVVTFIRTIGYAAFLTFQRTLVIDYIVNKKVHNVRFIGGCSGNTQGVASLVEGMDAEKVISRLKGIKCGFKNTSCPDQLSTALEEVLNK